MVRVVRIDNGIELTRLPFTDVGIGFVDNNRKWYVQSYTHYDDETCSLDANACLFVSVPTVTCDLCCCPVPVPCVIMSNA